MIEIFCKGEGLYRAVALCIYAFATPPSLSPSEPFTEERRPTKAVGRRSFVKALSEWLWQSMGKTFRLRTDIPMQLVYIC